MRAAGFRGRVWREVALSGQRLGRRPQRAAARQCIEQGHDRCAESQKTGVENVVLVIRASDPSREGFAADRDSRAARTQIVSQISLGHSERRTVAGDRQFGPRRFKRIESLTPRRSVF